MLDMRRRQFITLLGGAAVAWPLAAAAQQGERVRRIAVVNLIAASDPEAPPRIAALEMALTKLGWAMGRDLRIDYYWDAGVLARARAIASQVAATTPDLILSVTTPPTQVLREEAASVPIVFLQVFDPVSTGLVASLARPGGSVTGFTNFEPSMASKWAQLLREVDPRIRKIALMFNPATPGVELYLHSAEAASSASVLIKSSPVHSVDEVAAVMLELKRESNAGLVLPADTFATNNRDLIISLAAQHRVPTVYPFRYFATAGGLLSYGIDATDLFRQSASYIDLILRGTKPADLPVQQPTKFELVINLKTAKALNLNVPDRLLALADEVIE